MDSNNLTYHVALEDFKRARQQAAVQQLLARLTGRSVDLLSYDVVQEGLGVLGSEERGVQEIPLDKIVGSVGRYQDFTRDFLPKGDSNRERWASVKTAVMEMKGMRPIEVYQVGEVYFVKDGNHRVSVARQLGTDTISAYVTEVKTRVPLAAADDPNEVICKARYADFLQKTNLDRLRPDADLLLTFCNQFQWFLDQIAAHQAALPGDIDDATAVTDWYDNVYLPVVELMREQGIGRNFPQRTEADLYLLLNEHQEELEAALGWEIDTETAVSDLTATERRRSRSLITRVGQRLRRAFIPEELAEGPKTGRWRQTQLAAGRGDRLFSDYLVALRGSDADWQMLTQLFYVAQWEDDRLLGLHVVPDAKRADAAEVKAIGERFRAECEAAGVDGEFAVAVGDIVDNIIERAAYADLVVTSLSHPPGPQSLRRLGHGFYQLAQRCPRPLLAIPPEADSTFDRLLFPYDGSPKADEALFLATYFKSRWPISLVVLTVETEHTAPAALDEARRYIEQYDINDVEYVLRQKPIAEAVLAVAAEYGCNEIIMGGFGYRPLRHLVLGSTVDQLLCEFHQPILICR